MASAAAASLVVEVNTSLCAVPGDQLELPGATRQRKTGEKPKENRRKEQLEGTIEKQFSTISLSAVGCERLEVRDVGPGNYGERL